MRACNPLNLASVSCTVGSREQVDSNSTRYVAQASYSEVVNEGLKEKKQPVNGKYQIYLKPDFNIC